MHREAWAAAGSILPTDAVQTQFFGLEIFKHTELYILSTTRTKYIGHRADGVAGDRNNHIDLDTRRAHEQGTVCMPRHAPGPAFGSPPFGFSCTQLPAPTRIL